MYKDRRPWQKRSDCAYVKQLDIDLHALEDPHFSRADLAVLGIRHEGPSFEGRVYLNNARADASTPKTPEAGYVGSFFVFGHGGCGGDPGHCDYRPRGEFDFRRRHHMAPADALVPVTRGLAALRNRGEHLRAITIVPVLRDPAGHFVDMHEDLLRFDEATLRVYSAGRMSAAATATSPLFATVLQDPRPLEVDVGLASGSAADPAGEPATDVDDHADEGVNADGEGDEDRPGDFEDDTSNGARRAPRRKAAARRRTPAAQAGGREAVARRAPARKKKVAAGKKAAAKKKTAAKKVSARGPTGARKKTAVARKKGTQRKKRG